MASAVRVSHSASLISVPLRLRAADISSSVSGRPARASGGSGVGANSCRKLASPALHEPPGELGRKIRKPAARRQANRLEDHTHAALDVAEAVIADRLGEVERDAAIMTIGHRVGLVAAMKRESQLVVLAFGDTAERNAKAPQDTDPFAGEIAAHVVVEEFEVAEF